MAGSYPSFLLCGHLHILLMVLAMRFWAINITGATAAWRLRFQHQFMIHGFSGRLLLFLLPMMLTGCCTYLTVDTATHAFRHDSVQRIEKAVIAQDGKLVILVEGTAAESSHVKQFTITVSLPASEDGVWVPQAGMAEGWELGIISSTDTLPVTVAQPVVLPAYQSARGNQDRFLEIAGAERTLYLVKHLKPDRQTFLFYVVKGQHSRKIDIGLDGRDVKTPRRYPFLMLVPITLPIDVATLPFQIYFLSTLGDRPHNSTEVTN